MSPFSKSDVRRILFSYFLVSIVYSLGIQLYGPYLRSMVSCETPVQAGQEFSGSAYCGDASHVLAVAQAEEGALVSMKLAIHALAGPFLGSLADRIGRRPMLIMSLGGFTVAFFLFFLSSLSHRFHSFPVMAVCFLIEGATNAFNVVYMSMLADSTQVSDRASAFAAYQMTGAASQVLAQLASVSILRRNLTSYATVWFLQFVLLAADVFFAWYAIRESLLSLMPGHHDIKLVPMTLDIVKGPFQLLRSEAFLRLWLVSVVVSNLGAGLSGILASYTIAVYGWLPGDYQSLSWISKCLQTGSLAVLSPLMNTHWRPASIAMLQTTSSFWTSFLQVFAPFSPTFLFGPNYIMDTLAFSAPADAAFLSLQFGAEKQARVNAVQHFFANFSTSISIALFSSPVLFQPDARHIRAMRPFVASFLLVAVGTVLKGLLIWPHLRHPCVPFRTGMSFKSESADELSDVI